VTCLPGFGDFAEGAAGRSETARLPHGSRRYCFCRSIGLIALQVLHGGLRDNTHDNVPKQDRPNGPVDRINDGPLKASIWKNASDKGKDFYTAELTRTYKDADGTLRNAHSFIDDFTRERLALVADTSLSGLRVARELDALIWQRGARPKTIVSDNVLYSEANQGFANRSLFTEGVQ